MTQFFALVCGAAALVSFVIGFAAGNSHMGKLYHQLKADVEVSRKLHEAEVARLTKHGEELEAKLKQRKVEIKTVTKEVVREIPVLVGDGVCINDGWVRVHDAAVAGVSVASREPDGAAGEVTAARAAEVVVSNYGECLAWREQLLSLQGWVFSATRSPK